MKKIHNPEIGINLNDSPDNLLKKISGLLDDSSYPDMHNAMIALGNSGKTIIPQLHEILCSEKGKNTTFVTQSG